MKLAIFLALGVQGQQSKCAAEQENKLKTKIKQCQSKAMRANGESRKAIKQFRTEFQEITNEKANMRMNFCRKVSSKYEPSGLGGDIPGTGQHFSFDFSVVLLFY